MRNALSLALFVFLGVAAAQGQDAWSGWETPAGHRLGRPGLTAPVIKAAPIPDGLFQQEHGYLANTVDVLATIGKRWPRQSGLDSKVTRWEEGLPQPKADPRLREWARGLRSPYEPGVSTPIRIMSMTPAYPDAVQASRSWGSVEIGAEVLPDGTIGRMMVLPSVGKAGDEAAVRAVKEWRYLPAMDGGVPVTTFMVVTVTYHGPNGLTP